MTDVVSIRMNGRTGKYCPLCGEELVLRQNLKNRQVFLGCETYPKCKYTAIVVWNFYVDKEQKVEHSRTSVERLSDFLK